MRNLSVQAITLRSRRVNEADRLLDILTSEDGLLQVKARGAAKSKRRFLGACEPFSHGRFSLTRGGPRRPWYLDQALIDEPFEALRTDLPAYYLACYACEAILAAVERGHPQPDLFDLLLSVFRWLGQGAKDLAIVKVFFDLHLLFQLGVLAEFGACATCGGRSSSWFFDTRGGGMQCPAHRHDLHGRGIEVTGGTARILEALSPQGDDDGRQTATGRAARLSWSGRQRAEALRVTESMFQAHVGRRLRSSTFLDPVLVGNMQREDLPWPGKKSSPGRI